jgi:hypothetical protein
LEKEQRLGVRLLQEQESAFVLESRQTVGKMKDGTVSIVEFSKVSSANLGHKISDWE